MKAITYDRYGGPEELQLRDIATPSLAADEVLVRTEAAALHIGDLFFMRGQPWPVRLVSGLRRPSYGVPGLDLAGTIEAVGSRVVGLAPGDAVFGSGQGSCAELVRAKPSALLRRPAGLSAQQAAALPTSAITALRGLRDAGQLRAGQRVLINGAAGGVGSFAVQLAKAMGAEVTAVCSGDSAASVRSLGADHLIDYRQTDFTTAAERYDLILDNIENHPLAAVRRALTPQGTLVLNSGTGAEGLQMFVRLMRSLVLAPFVRHTLRRYVCATNRIDLQTLSGFVEAGQLRPLIERTFPLAETRAALQLIESGRARGKVIITF